MSELSKSVGFNSVVLGLFALITAVLLATTHLATKEPIANAEREMAKRALLEIMPLEQHTNDLLMDRVTIAPEQLPLLGLKAGEVHIARQGDAPVAMIIPATAHDGYSGDIRMLVGVHIDGTLAGVRITAHTETPGLGDKVDLKKSPWVLSFKGKSLKNPESERWKVKKDGGDFDQFTGATITPRAVVNQVRKALTYFQQNREQLLKSAAVKSSPPQQPQQEPTDG